MWIAFLKTVRDCMDMANQISIRVYLPENRFLIDYGRQDYGIFNLNTRRYLEVAFDGGRKGLSACQFRNLCIL